MPLTKDELREFHRFVGERVDCGDIDSLVDLVSEWESRRREMEQSVADIRQSHAEIATGNVSSVTDAFADVRKQLGIK